MSKIADISDVLLMLGLASGATEEQRAWAQFALNAAEAAVTRHLRYNPALGQRVEYYPNMDFSLTGRTGTWEVSDTQAYYRTLSESAVDEIQVSHLPIRASDENGENPIDLRIDYDGRSGTRSGSFAAGTQQTEGSDFFPNYETQDANGYSVCRDGIIRSEGRWPNQPGSVKITYMSGYTQDEFRGNGGNIDAFPIYETVISEAVRRVKKISTRAKRVGAGLTVGPLTSENLGDYSYSADGAVLGKLVGTDDDLMYESVLKLNEYINYGAMLAS